MNGVEELLLLQSERVDILAPHSDQRHFFHHLVVPKIQLHSNEDRFFQEKVDSTEASIFAVELHHRHVIEVLLQGANDQHLETASLTHSDYGVLLFVPENLVVQSRDQI